MPQRSWLSMVLVLGVLGVLLPAAASGQFVINEIDYDQDGDDNFEVIEIRNVTDEPQSLSDWDLEIVPGVRGNFPPALVQPGEYFVICGNFGGPQPCNFRFPRNDILPDTGAEIRMITPADEIAVSAVYGATPDAFVDSPGAPSVALARCPDSVDSGDDSIDFVPVPLTNGRANACGGLVSSKISEAGTVGDQLLFFFDARSGRTTFLTIGNPSLDAVLVEVVFYSQSLATRLAEETILLAGAGATVVDPTTVDGVSGHAGLVTVTPIVGVDDHAPVVPPRPLVGGYTIANLALGAGFGQNPFGRLAVSRGPGIRPDIPRAAPGVIVDGNRVRYQAIQPGLAIPALVVPAHFDPTDLAPPEQDGNRLLLAAFTETYDAPVGPGGTSRFTLEPRARTVSADFFDDAGVAVAADQQVLVSGVYLDSLQGLAGATELDRPGRVELTLGDPPQPGDGVFGLFGQALGTFAVGQRLPGLTASTLPAGNLTEPLRAGDQLLFPYDARQNRTTFLLVGNPNTDDVVVEVVFHAQPLTARLAEDTFTIPAGGVRVIDPTSGFAGVSGNVGLAIVTPIASASDHTPVLHAEPLTGGFTIVNLVLGAGFGQSPFARLAVDASGVRPALAPGATAVVDGTTIAYQTITPPTSPRISGSEAPTLTIPVYFNPETLAPAADDGNRLIFASFFEEYAAPVGPGGEGRFAVMPASQFVSVRIIEHDGTVLLDDGTTIVGGVTLHDLAELAGELTLDEPGRVEFQMVPPSGASVFGLFGQAIGTFAVGQRLPPLDVE